MATVQSRSRYTRPLKATHSFTKGPPTSTTNGQRGQSPVGGGMTGHTLCSSLPTSPSSLVVSGGQRYSGSLERRAHSSHTHSTESNPRRSSSLGSLYDDSFWTTPTSQQDSETEERSEFTHKRSNSLSAADHLQQNGSRRVHTCTSVEGLNQEVSRVLEGQPSMMSYHPDGHIAPVQDLLRQVSMGGTPPHLHTTPSPHSTPLTASHHHNSDHSVEANTDNQSLPHARDSPATSDYGHHHPLSPKPSFAREPPVGAERCITRHNTRLFPADFIQMGPDRSKVNIIFKGTVFAPTSPALPMGGIKC